jgi:hypothetical protein
MPFLILDIRSFMNIRTTVSFTENYQINFKNSQFV